MEQVTNEIKLSYTDKEINTSLENLNHKNSSFKRHFNQTEEFFLDLEDDFIIPSLPIHHDVRQPRPSPEYLKSLLQILEQILPLTPGVFNELTYLFDPREIMKPCFFKLYKIDQASYLYLVQIDLIYRSREARVLERGNNDFTARYSSRRLFLETLFIPLDRVLVEEDKIRSFIVKQTISSTWVGEVGRGYFIQGIWIDNELTRFFSKLFLPEGKRTYPFYPYVCKYRTICQNLIRLNPEARKLYLPYLHRAIEFLSPSMKRIEQSMRDTSFSEDIETYKEIKKQVPVNWLEIWNNLKIDVYLNQQDMKEFSVED
ncbi:hypothetical protein ES705_38302 [subsurface metagenome]